MLIETDRLLIRDWAPTTDAEQALQIYSDRDVTNFLLTKSETIEQQIQILQRWVSRAAELNDGTGFWAIVIPETKEIVGTIILKQLPDNDGNPTQDYEVGWHLKRSAWGKGYATEAAQAVLDYGFNSLKLPVIYAVVNPANIASIRVTQRLGMAPLGCTNQYYNAELELFKRDAPFA